MKKFPPPDKGLGPPKMKFKDTFSAEELVLAMLPSSIGKDS